MKKLSGPVSFRFDAEDYKVLKDNNVNIPELIRHTMRRAAHEIKEMEREQERQARFRAARTQRQRQGDP